MFSWQRCEWKKVESATQTRHFLVGYMLVGRRQSVREKSPFTMKPIATLFIIIGCQLPVFTLSRSWTEIYPYHGFSSVDWGGLAALSEQDPLSPITVSPSPTENPTLMPTVIPSPTSKPTGRPTELPTSSPTIMPSVSPTTAPVTPAPSQRAYPEIPPPQNPNEGYFNYDYRTIHSYGPGQPQLVHYNSSYFRYAYPGNAWTKVSTTVYNYWNEFGNDGFGPWQGTLAEHMPGTNKCDNVGLQSPIDVRETVGSRCREDHEIRSRVSVGVYLECIFSTHMLGRESKIRCLGFFRRLVIYVLKIIKRFRN